jgi:hypothetical protein
MKRASAMRVIYFYETSRRSEPFFPTAVLEQRSVPISLMAMSVNYRGQMAPVLWSSQPRRGTKFSVHLCCDGGRDVNIPISVPELPLSDRSELHFKCERRPDPAGSRFKACPPRRTRQPGNTGPVHLFCRTWCAAAAKSCSFIYSVLLEI